MKRAAIYARVSTEDQVEGTSLTTQVAECLREAGRRGYQVLEGDIYREDASGALGLEKRPVLASLWAAYQEGLYDAIIVWHTDRLSRNLGVFYSLVQAARQRRPCGTVGDGFIFARVPTEDSPEGRLLLSQLAAFAEYERERIKLRTITGKLARAREGAFFGGGELFGYRWDRTSRRWEIVDDEAKTVRLIFQMYVYGWDGSGPMGTIRIAEELQRMGVPTPNQAKGTHFGRPSKTGTVGEVWSGVTVQRILSHTAYCGTHYFWRGSARLRPETIQETWLPTPFPSIVDRDLFEKAQAKRLKARGGFNRKKPVPLLSGRIRCGLCRLAYGVTVKGGKEAYKCNGRQKKYHLDGSPRCPSPIIIQEVLESQVKEALLSLLETPESVRRAVEDYLANLERERAVLEVSLGPHRERLEAIRERLRRLNTVYLSGAIDDQEYHQRLKDLKEQEQKVLSAMRDSEGELESLEALSRQITSVREALQQGRVDARYTPNGEEVKGEMAWCRISGGRITVGYPEQTYTWPQLLDLLQVKCVVYDDRVDLQGVFPPRILPIHKVPGCLRAPPDRAGSPPG